MPGSTDNQGDTQNTRTFLGPVPEKSLRLGPYKLLQQVAEGGMGAVWMADQESPVRRRVAVKLIKTGHDTRQVIARFEAERQALAIMDHPNIAKVLDAGASDDGRPYFVMEFFPGISITKFCDQHKLSIEKRLELFISVCNAVQHAHQKGIIHRDLKPSNVLVAESDGEPVTKVIDFGLAKALQHQTKLTDRSLFTEFGQVVGTLQYMSPEQAELRSYDIDTRTDIYSLGVVLYELLVGSTPIDPGSLEKVGMLKVLESIREKEPPRPSVLLSSCAHDAASAISAQRRIDPTRLKNSLRGDLDWIVMKALDKDRAHRYESAASFAEEIRRYLSGEPIQARPPSARYRLSKYVRRNKGLVAAISGVVAALLIGIITTSWFAIDANIAKRAQIKLRERAAESAMEAHVEASRANVAEQRANRETSKANAALADAEEKLARITLLLAQARWKEGRAGESLELLEQIPESHRSPEWYVQERLIRNQDPK